MLTTSPFLPLCFCCCCWPSGTRDFYPEEMRLRNWLFGQWSDVARLYGFEQFDVPVLESEELFTRKAGEEITEQLYNFEVRQGRGGVFVVLVRSVWWY